MPFPEALTDCQCTEERLFLEESFEGGQHVLIEPHLSKPTQESGVKQTHKIPPPFTAYTHKCQATFSTLPSSTTVLHCQWLPLPCSLETDHNHLASYASLGYSCCITPGTWARGQQSSSQVKHRTSQAVRISTSECAQQFLLKRVVHKMQAILPVKEQLILGHLSWTDLQP